MKELEMEERRLEEQNKRDRFNALLRLAIAGLGLVMVIVGYFAGSASGDSDSPFYMVTLVGIPLLFGESLFERQSRSNNNKND